MAQKQGAKWHKNRGLSDRGEMTWERNDRLPSYFSMIMRTAGEWEEY